MADYISRESLLEDIDEAVKHRGMGEIIGQTLRRYILRQPAADAVDVVHGRWIYHDDGVFTCSECGNAESSDSHYCRLCGAKMDWEQLHPSNGPGADEPGPPGEPFDG